MTQHQPLPLVGYIEIAQRAGVQRALITMWRKRHDDFPRPVADLRVGPVWWWPDVQRWLASSGRVWDADLSLEEVNRGVKDRVSMVRRGGS